MGYLFGRDSEICDIFLGRSEVKSVGRRHFAIQVVMHHGEPSLLFRSFASYGTTVRSHTLGNQRIETQRSIPTGEREYVINIGPLQLRLEFPDHSRHSELWRDHLACHYGGHVFQTPRVAHVKARANDNVWTKHYHDISWIGSGGYGTVYRAQHNFSGAIHAVKELKVNRCRRSEIKLRDLLLLKNVCYSAAPARNLWPFWQTAYLIAAAGPSHPVHRNLRQPARCCHGIRQSP